MHGVDTNVVVRYLIGDDAQQGEKARALIGHSPVFIPRTVFLETAWVLHSTYGMASEQVIQALRAFAGLPGVLVEDAGMVAKAMAWADAGMDLADALHLASATRCEDFLTFDKRFAQAGRRIGGIPIKSP